MAIIIENSVEYAWGNIATATNEGSTLTSSDITIDIPHTTTRTFISAILEITVHDNEAVIADNLTGITAGLSCNGGTNWTDIVQTGMTIDQSGENMSQIIQVDVVAELTARFGSGASNTTTRFRLNLDYNNVGNQFLNVSAKIIITYSADIENANTHVVTARIPIESLTAILASATRTQIGSAQIPNLSTFFKEPSISFKAIFAELWFNTMPAGTTDSTLTFDLDAGSPSLVTGTFENGNQSSMICRIIWNLLAAGMTTNASHSIYATANSVAMGVNMGGWIVVTYTYDESTMTADSDMLVSVLIAGKNDQRFTNWHGAEFKHRVEYIAAEAGAIALQQSAIVCFGAEWSADRPFQIKAGAQAAYRTYDSDQLADPSGSLVFIHRVDSGGAGGAAYTLAAGVNNLDVSWQNPASVNVNPVSSMFILNYTCKKGNYRSMFRNRTVFKLLKGFLTVAAASTTWTGAVALLNISQTVYALNSVGFMIDSSAAFTTVLSLEASRGGAEGIGAGTKVIGQTLRPLIPGERGTMRTIFSALDIFKNTQNDARFDRFDIETLRTFALYTLSTVSYFSLCAFVVIHYLIKTVNGKIYGFSGDGSGIVVDLFRSDTKEYVATTTTSAGGIFSIAVPDDNVSRFFTARQSDTDIGRSPNFTSATEVNINLISSSPEELSAPLRIGLPKGL